MAAKEEKVVSVARLAHADGTSTIEVGPKALVRVAPRATTVELWVIRAELATCLLNLSVDQARELEAALARGIAHLERNRRVLTERPGVYGGMEPT